MDSVLDIGCGTGAVLAELTKTFPNVVGVDLLPGMVEVAQAKRGGLDVRTGDMRTVRLGQRFDIVVCVGNALSYLLEDDDVTAAFDTFAAHCKPDGVLVIQTLTMAPAAVGPKTSQVRMAGQTVTVTVEFQTDGNVLVMRRSWEFDDGRHETDQVHRRVLGAAELKDFAARADFIEADGTDLESMRVYRFACGVSGASCSPRARPRS